MNTISINGRFLCQQVTGVQRFGREILSSIITPDSEGESKAIEILIPNQESARALEPYRCTIKGVGRFRGHAWEQLELARAARNHTLVNLCNTAPIFRRQQIVVLHDVMVAAYPDNFTFAFRAWYRTMIAGYIRCGAKIATVSKFSASEISRYFGVPLHSIDVIPESGEHFRTIQADESILEKHGLEPDRYFLAASSAASNKNFAAVIHAANRMNLGNFKFVIVGGANARVFGNNPGMDDDRAVTRTGYVTDQELRALYQNAACFVYPSFYEGFGLPPLEAMSCGCPVVVANAASLPEVCADAAIYCDPHDFDSLISSLERVRDNPELRKELRERCLEQSLHWRWRDAGDAILSMAGRV